MFLTFVEDFADYIGDIGLTGDFGLVFMALVLTVGVVVGLLFIKVPSIIAIMIGVAMILMFAMWGWFPIWLVVAIAIIIFILLFVTLKGGVSNA